MKKKNYPTEPCLNSTLTKSWQMRSLWISGMKYQLILFTKPSTSLDKIIKDNNCMAMEVKDT